MYVPGTIWPTYYLLTIPLLRDPRTLTAHSATTGGLASHKWLIPGLEFVVFCLLVFEFKFLSCDLPISIPVLVGEHILHNHLSIESRGKFPFARCHLGMNVLWELERKGQDRPWDTAAENTKLEPEQSSPRAMGLEFESEPAEQTKSSELHDPGFFLQMQVKKPLPKWLQEPLGPRQPIHSSHWNYSFSPNQHLVFHQRPIP